MAQLAEGSAGALTTVTIRIGWVLRGENRAADINPSGTPGGVPATEVLDPEGEINERWFRAMWLSNRDLSQLIDKSLTADPARWPTHGLLVNGVSHNRGMGWSLDEAREFLGFEPEDDLYRELERG
jgi:hypothetical protein